MKTRTSRQPNGKAVAQRVHFELAAPHAQSVCIAGSFNDWHPQATPMIAINDGRWAKDLMLPPGEHQYRFIVDGEWISDPHAAETVPNAFGTTNTLLKLNEQTNVL